MKRMIDFRKWKSVENYTNTMKDLVVHDATDSEIQVGENAYVDGDLETGGDVKVGGDLEVDTTSSLGANLTNKIKAVASPSIPVMPSSIAGQSIEERTASTDEINFINDIIEKMPHLVKTPYENSFYYLNVNSIVELHDSETSELNMYSFILGFITIENESISGTLQYEITYNVITHKIQTTFTDI